MSDLKDLVKRYIIRQDRAIKKICAPLKERLDIPNFTYYSIDSEGNYTFLSSYPEQIDFFYQNELFKTCPHLRDPRFFRSGYSLINAVDDPNYAKISKSKYNIDKMFLMQQRSGDSIEGFLFSRQKSGENDAIGYLHQLDLLKKFGGYFKREAQPLLEKMKGDKYNLKKAKGAAFSKEVDFCPLSVDPTEADFLKDISPLSPREQECLDLYVKGHSAQTTAAMLGLSQRTVEHYFDNIKNKLGLTSKRDLFSL